MPKKNGDPTALKRGSSNKKPTLTDSSNSEQEPSPRKSPPKRKDLSDEDLKFPLDRKANAIDSPVLKTSKSALKDKKAVPSKKDRRFLDNMEVREIEDQNSSSPSQNRSELKLSPPPQRLRRPGPLHRSGKSLSPPAPRSISPAQRSCSADPKSSSPAPSASSPTPKSSSPAPRSSSPAPKSSSAPRSSCSDPGSSSTDPKSSSPSLKSSTPAPSASSPIPKSSSPGSRQVHSNSKQNQAIRRHRHPIPRRKHIIPTHRHPISMQDHPSSKQNNESPTQGNSSPKQGRTNQQRQPKKAVEISPKSKKNRRDDPTSDTSSVASSEEASSTSDDEYSSRSTYTRSFSEGDGSDDLQISKIIDKRKTAKGTIEYNVKWKGYGTKHNSWIREVAAVRSNEPLVGDFERNWKPSANYGKKPKPLTREEKEEKRRTFVKRRYLRRLEAKQKLKQKRVEAKKQ